MKLKLICIAFLVLVVSSCKTSKVITGSNKAFKTLSSKDIINTHKAATPNFSTLAARMQVVYEKDGDLQSITVSLRMEKDKKIWVKASLLGITIAKLYITPESVSYYETVSNTYFDGDFSLLSNWLGTNIDYQKAQAILLGQTIFDLDTNYKSQVVANKYKLQPKMQLQNFIYSFMLYPDTFKVASETLSQPENERLFTINYGEYKHIKGGFYPSTIKIIATETNSKTTIDVSYKKIDHNASIGFPFKIPKGYKKIELN